MKACAAVAAEFESNLVEERTKCVCGGNFSFRLLVEMVRWYFDFIYSRTGLSRGEDVNERKSRNNAK